MADIIRFVDRDENGGAEADGQTWGNAYPSLTAWSEAEATDLVDDDDNHIVYFRAGSGNPETGETIWTNWVTDSTHRITIIVPFENRHGFQRGQGTAIARDVNWGAALTEFPAYTTIEGLRVENVRTASGNHGGITLTAAGIRLNGCFCIGADGGTGLGIGADAADATIINCVGLAYGGRGININASGCVLVNSVFYSHDADGTRRQNHDATIISCYAYGGEVDYSTTTGVQTTNSYSGDGTMGSTQIADPGFVSTTSGSEDFRLTSGSPLIGAGQDNSEHERWFGSAIDGLGTTRPQGSEWDVGPFEYPAVADLPMPHYIYGDGR